MNQTIVNSWRNNISNLDEVLAGMSKQRLISVGIPPYPRIIPSVFLPDDCYYLYCAKMSADIAVLKDYANIVCLGETDPELAEKVQSTGYLIKNFKFQNFLKTVPRPYSLLFFQTTLPILEMLEEMHIPWIGHDPKSFEPVLHKDGFKKVLKELHIECIPDWIVTVPQFLNKGYEELYARWSSPFVCQPGDYEVSGSTQFVRSPEDLERTKEIFLNEKRLEKVNLIRLSPFVTGEAVSMLGCVTHKGVLSGPLQLQLIDIPESLHGVPPSGAFFGHDWDFHEWPQSAEEKAQVIVEKIGEWLRSRGYKGIFGIDFMYDKVHENVYPLECNPRSTGAIPAFSEVNILQGVPPIDFFTLAEFLNINVDFNFEAINSAWKQHLPASHVSLIPQGIEKMKLNFPAGAYSFNPDTNGLKFERKAAFLHELKPEEFIIIDQIPLFNQPVVQNVPRLFKFIFRAGIAQDSGHLKPKYAKILFGISTALRS